MSDDKMAQNAGKTFTDTAGVSGKDGGKGIAGGAAGGKTPDAEPTDAERAIMKQKAIDAAAAKGG